LIKDKLDPKQSKQIGQRYGKSNAEENLHRNSPGLIPTLENYRRMKSSPFSERNIKADP